MLNNLLKPKNINVRATLRPTAPKLRWNLLSVATATLGNALRCVCCCLYGGACAHGSDDCGCGARIFCHRWRARRRGGLAPQPQGCGVVLLFWFFSISGKATQFLKNWGPFSYGTCDFGKLTEWRWIKDNLKSIVIKELESVDVKSKVEQAVQRAVQDIVHSQIKNIKL